MHELAISMETRDICISTEALLTEKNLRNRSHTRLGDYLHEEFLVIAHIDFFIRGTDRGEEILGHGAVWTVVLGVDDESHMLGTVNRDSKQWGQFPKTIQTVSFSLHV